MQQRIRTLIKIVISFGLFSYLVYNSDPQRIVAVLGNVYKENGIIYLSIATVFALLSIFLMSLRWKITFASYDVNISLKKLSGFYFIGLFFNNFLPTSIGGDIVRVYKAIEESEDRTASFASVIVERILGIAATLFMAIISLFYVSHYFNDERILYTSIILFGLIVSSLILITRKRPFDFLLKVFEKITLLNIGEKVNKLMEAIYTLKERRRVFVWVFILSILSQVAIVLMNYAFVKALDIQVDLSYLFLVVPVTIIITMLPSINGVGVRDSGFVVLLSKIGISGAAAISLSFMNVLIPMIISIWGGILFLVQRKKSKINEVKILEKNL